MSHNILLAAFDTPFQTPPFDKIDIEDYLPAIVAGIEKGKKEVEAIAQAGDAPTFANTIEALEYAGADVNRVAEVFFNLNSAETNDRMQELAREISPLLTEYSNDILLNQELFRRIETVYLRHKDAIDKRPEGYELTAEQLRLLLKNYKNFVRNGALLTPEQKERLREIDKEKAQLSLAFGENVLKETNNYELLLTDEKDLAGLPEYAVEAAAGAAKEKGYEGWLITLDYPSYIPFMTYADSRELREKLFRAFSGRACRGNEFDNKENVKKIAALRYERAVLLGYASHAHFVLEERMAKSPVRVNEFLKEMLTHGKPAGEVEVKEVAAYALKHGGPESLQRWDFGYWSEKLKKERYEVNDELLKPYFMLEKVVAGVFETSRRLYGLHFERRNDIAVYHPDVETYEVKDEAGMHLAILYADFFPRPGKRDGAWMTSFRGQRVKDGVDERPLISIVCNFTKPTATKPSLLTFNEVTTLFHEFGHALHGMLAAGTYETLSGTNVLWDFVELPSQVFENWCYEKECLDLFARHYQTGEPVPAELVEKIKASANFLEGYQTVRQVGLGTLDMAWHAGDPSGVADPVAFEIEAIKEAELLPKPAGLCTSCSFSHIFQGGYSSGYYSYKWAEVLDADAFEYFKETGIFNKDTADKFKKFVLSAGDTQDPTVLYRLFRGRDASPKALLRRAGLIKE